MHRLLSLLAPLALFVAMLVPAAADAAQPMTLPSNTPTWVPNAQNLGPADASQVIDFTVWLTLKNESQLAQQAQAVVTPGSGSYHQFQRPAQVQASFDPSSSNVNAVQNYLRARGFTIVDTAQNNFYVKAQGTIGQVEQAFHVAVNNYRYAGHTYRSNASNPQVDSTMNGIIAAITGIDSASYYQPTLVSQAAAEGATSPASWPEVCGGPSYSTSIKLQNEKPVKLNGFIPCGYGAAQIEDAYGINQLCTVSNGTASGTCGQDQTIVITDGYGSTTLQQDVNAYDQVNGLPPLTVGQNLIEVTPPGIANMPESPAQDPLGWKAEVTLDVENAHAIAPLARIVLIASPNNYSDLDEALNFNVVHHFGTIVSDSWANFEGLMNPGQVQRDERILEAGVLEGIGANFASGDWGDNSAFTGSANVSFPASSPFATGIGGTSLFLNANNSWQSETGWGTHEARDYNCVDPASGYYSSSETCSLYAAAPLNYGFIFGSGGGVSRFFQVPQWQTGTGSSMRSVPDVSMLADPYTGSTIYITDGGTSPVPETYGGTSLATPLFSGEMALVDQLRTEAGKAGVGLAAPYMYNLSPSTLHDENPATDPSFADSGSGLYYGSGYTGRIFTINFDQDTTLSTKAGWDDMTGVGSPNGAAFINAVANQ